MRIAIATEQDFVSPCFGCSSACMIVEIEEGEICRTFIIPNPGWSHKYWADLLERNSVTCLIAGNIGANATGVLKWHGIQVISGVKGQIDDVVEKYLSGVLAPREAGCTETPAGHSTSDCPFSKAT